MPCTVLARNSRVSKLSLGMRILLAVLLPSNFGGTGIHKIRQSKNEPVCGRMKSTADGFLCIRESQSCSKGSFEEKSAHPERKAEKHINNFRCITEVSKVEVFVQQI